MNTEEHESHVAAQVDAANTESPEATVKVGDRVMFVLPDGRSEGQSRPAFVVQDWGGNSGHGINLQVLTDNSNDYLAGPGNRGFMWATSVHYSREKKPRTWHRMEDR